MKLFIDSANLNDIELSLKRGLVKGVTTNPSILAKEPKGDFILHMKKIVGLLREYNTLVPLSIEVFSTKKEEMVRQAETFLKELNYEKLNIKIPIGWDELEVIHSLRRRGIEVNCTCCMSYNQAMMAANAGANFVSLFYGRIRDVGYNAYQVVEETAKTLKTAGSPSEIIVGSIRHIHDINDAMKAGAHIVTVPPQFFPQMVKHPKTDEAVKQFVTDFENWMK
ncbi:MAG: fructose-6-phosphate aldolase [Deltaproteobacteria bacterium]|nr:fructose-6-phosphate aldolase [Deltaproteobacteria bacterium]MBI3294789.1 fructose-6-phosphate aldolase [Deltaproteobacteria bacterium]